MLRFYRPYAELSLGTLVRKARDGDSHAGLQLLFWAYVHLSNESKERPLPLELSAYLSECFRDILTREKLPAGAVAEAMNVANPSHRPFDYDRPSRDHGFAIHLFFLTDTKGLTVEEACAEVAEKSGVSEKTVMNAWVDYKDQIREGFKKVPRKLP